MTKEEKQRQMGMQFAYHIVKEGGLEALEKRLTRSEQTKCPCTVPDIALHRFEQDVKHATILTVMSLALMVLDEEFGKDAEMMNRFCHKYVDLADTVYGGWLDWDGIRDYFRDEKGVDISHWMNVAEATLAKCEEVVDKRTVFVGGAKPFGR